ncbi:MAG: hydroxymethylglutaryl-CoA lyase [Pseudomonadota bacterium]
MDSPQNVEIVEVSSRDGIQNEATILDLPTKLELIRRAEAAGLRRIEVTSFVNPKRVPQMADADALMAALPPQGERQARYTGLALNRRGFERAVAGGVDEVNFVVVASDTFNTRNQGVPTAESVAAWTEMAAAAEGRIDATLSIAAAFGCPFEGEVPVARLLSVIEACLTAQPRELTLADTIGVASPRDVTERVGAIRARWPDLPIRLHLHNTRNTGFANAWAGIAAGVTALDSSFGGVGGCPFAPRATGNIATEDLVYMLERGGIATGISLDAAVEAAEFLERALGKTVPGLVMKAGGFPTGEAA